MAVALLGAALVGVPVASAGWGCAARDLLVRVQSPLACRTAVSVAASAPPMPVHWLAPAAARDRTKLDRWCEAVGPAIVPGVGVVTGDGVGGSGGTDRVAIVSWNVHVGGGDVLALVRALKAGTFSGGRPVDHFVLLLQEAYRSGPLVPSRVRHGLQVPSPIRPAARGARQDVASVATALGLRLYYVPSMRNGAAPFTDEDRGNAILSTLPLSDLQAIELPFERQRRVAIAATVHGHTSMHTPWTVRVTSAHLDNLAGPTRAWILTGWARRRQIRALLGALPPTAGVVLGGDLNTWFGSRDPAYTELVARFPPPPDTDSRPTFAGLLRLDHLALRLADGWKGRVTRLDDRFGSDHHPLLGWIEVGTASGRD